MTIERLTFAYDGSFVWINLTQVNTIRVIPPETDKGEYLIVINYFDGRTDEYRVTEKFADQLVSAIKGV